MRNDITEARDAVAPGVAKWNPAQPARVGKVTETVMVRTLHSFWSRLRAGERADRCDPDGKIGFKARLGSVVPEVTAAKPRGRR